MKENTSHPGTGPPQVGVLVRESNSVTSQGAVRVFSRCPRIRVLDQADRARADVLVAIEPVVDTAVLDWLREVRDQAVRPRPLHSVLVTDQLHTKDVLTAIESGVAAVLPLADLTIPDLVRTVLVVPTGEALLPPRVQGHLLTHLDRMRRYMLEPNSLTMSGLTIRELDVLRLVADGFSLEEIAEKLAYSDRTVKNVLYGLMERYGFSTRAHAVAYAVRAGII